jgi:hypothetical protein
MSVIDPQSPMPPVKGTPEEDAALIEAVAERIVRMGMAAPAIFFMESAKPLSYVGSQALVFLEPFVKSVLNLASYDRFVALLEDRHSIEILIQRVEALDEQARDEEKAQKQASKERKRQEQEARQGGAGGAPPVDDRGWIARLFRRKR